MLKGRRECCCSQFDSTKAAKLLCRLRDAARCFPPTAGGQHGEKYKKGVFSDCLKLVKFVEGMQTNFLYLL